MFERIYFHLHAHTVCRLLDLCIYLLNCNLALKTHCKTLQAEKYMTLYDYNNIKSNFLL